jgi:hypothetical protein
MDKEKPAPACSLYNTNRVSISVNRFIKAEPIMMGMLTLTMRPRTLARPGSAVESCRKRSAEDLSIFRL